MKTSWGYVTIVSERGGSMKFKIMDQEPIYLAGVVHYGSLETTGYEKLNREAKHKKGYGTFEKDEKFDRDLAAIRKNAQKIKEQVRKEMNFHAGEFENGGKGIHFEWHDNQSGGKERQVSVEEAFDSIGKAVGNLGKFVEKNSPKWETGIKDWGRNFEGNMEDFGKKMETWGEDFGKRMGEWGESFGEQWDNETNDMNPGSTLMRHPIYRTYEEIYERFIQDHPDHIKRQTFYEVQILDTSYEHVTSKVMVGSRMVKLEQMRYPVATMTFEPDRWVAVKLTREEFAKDWLGSLAKVPQLKPYTIEPYFIIRHKKNGPADEIRLFCPISEKVDER